MKKASYLLCCLCAVAAFSCSKQERDDVRPVKDGYILVDITARGECDGDTRTTISEGTGSRRTVEWEKGDRILVWYGAGSAEGEAVGSGSTTTFSVEVPATATDLVGIYPSDAAAAYDGGTISLTVPSEQSGSFARANVSVTKTSVGGGECIFYNATSYIKFVVTDPDITKITVESVGGEPLVGTLPLTFGTDGVVVPGTPSGTSSSVSLLVDGTGDYYISILPGVNYASGLKVRFYIDGDTKYSVGRGTYTTEDPVCVQRSQIASFGALDKRVGNIYVTVDGAGLKDGSSWENAISSLDLSNMLTLNTSAATVKEKCAKLDGNTFRLGAGTYDLGYNPVVDFTLNEAPCAIRIVGGYAAAGSDVSDPDTYVSAISGSGDHQAMILKKNVSAMFSAVTFSDGVAWNPDDAALQIRDGASARLTGCTVKDNRIADGKDFSSAGVYVDAASSLIAENSVFCDNSGHDASALKVCGPARVKDCTFNKNHSSVQYGAVSLNAAAGAQVLFEGCTFKENSVPEDTEACKGGAVGFVSGEATFEDCLFEGNYANQGGAVSLDGAGELKLKGTSFLNNHSLWKYNEEAVSFGGAIDVTGAGVLKADRCSFDGNYGTRGGAVSCQDGMAKLWFNACFFGKNYIINGHGTDIYLSVSEMCAFNNCCFIEGTYSTLGSGNADWIGVEAAGVLLIANTTMIGSPMKSSSDTSGSNAFVRLGYVSATEYFINNIMALPNTNSNFSVNARSELHTVYLYGNKHSKLNAGGSAIEKGYGDCEGYLQEGFFGNLELINGGTATDTYWKWNGEMRNAADTNKMSGSDVRRLMNEAAPAFCQWLTDECDNAMYKDQLGTTRGEQYWPGSYQNQ